MRRHPRLAAMWMLSAAILAISALTACSSSGTSTSTKTTSPAGSAGASSTTTGGAAHATAVPSGSPSSAGASSTSTGSAAPTTAAPSGSASPASLPSDACKLLTDQEASQLVGTTVTGHPGLPNPTASVCSYTGSQPITLTVENYADVAAAHTPIQQLLNQSIAHATNVPNLGDEAIVYQVGAAGGLKARRGTLDFTIFVSKGAPGAAALETAAKAILGRL